MSRPPRLFFVDHRDSFSENLVAALRARGCVVDVVVVDPHLKQSELSLEILLECNALVLSPGPLTPASYPFSLALLDRWPADRPLLGVCLGLQMMLVHAGLQLDLVSGAPVHGRREKLLPAQPSRWLPDNVFSGQAVFYNSWAVREEHLRSCPSGWHIIAHNGGFVAACENHFKPWLGVQYHPESFASEQGGLLLDAFVALLNARASIEPCK
ncbi:MAG: hypothetical protein RL189_1794 [Pseudomonadota bacterium]|jgi:anthranilate/para-aminobenzoate synthase component II